jgi:diaminopimelate decarboxylase
MMPTHPRLDLFPLTTTISGLGEATQLTIGGCSLVALAEEYGTPLYLYDQATMDAAAESYRQALARHYPAASGVTYAGKAFLCLAAAQWVQSQGFWLDCTGAGELYIATTAGVARTRILVHGVNKSGQDLAVAATQAGTIVVDNLVELKRLAALRHQQALPLPDLWLRVRPGVAVATHAYRQTGQEDSKFGMNPAEICRAVTLCQEAGLTLTGLHFHQGSHFHDVTPIGPALATVLDTIADVRATTGWEPAVLSPGGGWGVAYAEEELPQPSVEAYVAFIAEQVVAGCQARHLPLPRLQVEPGRSLVARAGVAIYQVGATKQSANRRWVLIDGGLADNPRPALYGARYTALPVRQPERAADQPTWIGGPFCESGDVLIHNLTLPELAEGELLAVPTSGAYHLAMGSNYNGARRPAVVWLHGGEATLIQRRERLDELVLRDLALPSIP